MKNYYLNTFERDLAEQSKPASLKYNIMIKHFLRLQFAVVLLLGIVVADDNTHTVKCIFCVKYDNFHSMKIRKLSHYG